MIDLEQALEGLDKLDEEQKGIVKRSLLRLADLSVREIGADEAARANLAVERGAILATLYTLGEEQGAKAGRRIMQLARGGLEMAIGAVLAQI
jgi:hypothetical protein